MQRMTSIILTLAVAAFIAATAMGALAPRSTMAVPHTEAMVAAILSMVEAPQPWAGLDEIVLRPRNVWLWGLLLALWAALTIHALRSVVMQQRQDMPAVPAPVEQPATIWSAPAEPEAHRLDNAPSEHAPLIVALLAGAVWTQLAGDQPVAAFIAAMVMLGGALTAATRGRRDGRRIRASIAAALLAGWAIVATYGSFAALLVAKLDMSNTIATSIALLLCAVAGLAVQIRLQGSAAFSVALIGALLGVAAATMGQSPMAAITATIGIAAMTVVLIREMA